MPAVPKLSEARRASQPPVESHELPAGSRRNTGESWVRQYPIAAGALVGLMSGALLFLLNPAASQVAFAAVALLCGIPLLWKTVWHMLSGRFHVDTIAALAIVVGFVEREFLASALVVLMQSGGEAIEDYGLRRANRSLDNLLKRAPSIAHRKEGDGYVDVPCAELKQGEIFCVRPGDIIPADGVIVEGTGNVDEAALTGEPIPLAKSAGDSIYSGTINLQGILWVRATATAAESKYEHIVRMV